MDIVTVTHRVTDISQVKFQAQDGGVCVSVKDGEWIWLAREVAFYLSASLDMHIPPCLGLENFAEEDEGEVEYEITYQLLDSVKSDMVTLKAISEADALSRFYEIHVPKNQRSNLGRVEIQKK